MTRQWASAKSIQYPLSQTLGVCPNPKGLVRILPVLAENTQPCRDQSVSSNSPFA